MSAITIYRAVVLLAAVVKNNGVLGVTESDTPATMEAFDLLDLYGCVVPVANLGNYSVERHCIAKDATDVLIDVYQVTATGRFVADMNGVAAQSVLLQLAKQQEQKAGGEEDETQA